MGDAAGIIEALEACNGNNLSMGDVFEKWIVENVQGQGWVGWDGQDHKDIFGLFSNDVSRSEACEKWARHMLKIGGRMAIEDVAALCSLTDNELSKEGICKACAPACNDGDRDSITEQCSNSIIAGNIREMKFGTRKWPGDLSDDSEPDADGSGDEGNYNGPPPPGMGGGGGGGGPPGGMFGAMMGAMGGGMPNPMGGNPAGGFFDTPDNADDADDFGEGGDDGFGDDGFGDDDNDDDDF